MLVQLSLFLDGPEGQWRKEILPVGRTPGRVACYPFCVERRVAQCKDIYKLPGSGDWFACLVRVLKAARLED